MPPDNRATAERISAGHAGDSNGAGGHMEEFPEAAGDREILADIIEGIRDEPSETKPLSGGRVAYWDDDSGIVVITNSRDPNSSTAFRPDAGKTLL